MAQQYGLNPPLSPMQQLARNRVRDPNMVGAIAQPLYDYQTKPAASSQMSFFQSPNGQGTKTLVDTNMQLAGSLPQGNRFAITSIQVELYPLMDISGATLSEFANDIQLFYGTGVLDLSIGNKSFCTQAPLNKFPPVNHLSVQTSSGTTAVNSTYAVPVGRTFNVVDMYLESNQAFIVTLSQMATLSADARVGVTLNGFLYRDVQ